MACETHQESDLELIINNKQKYMKTHRNADVSFLKWGNINASAVYKCETTFQELWVTDDNVNNKTKPK